MKTKKDVIFIITVILWITFDIIGFVFYGDMGVGISNLLCIAIFGTMTIIKMSYKKFGLWLEEPLSKQK